MNGQTSFETARGIAEVTYEKGFSLIVCRGAEDIGRILQGLRALEEAQLSFDSLKLGFGYFSFVVREEMQSHSVEVLQAAGFDASHHRSKAVLKVIAPNVRDDSGLMARIAEIVVNAGAIVYDVGDMNDGVVLVVQSEKAEQAVQALRNYMEASA